WRCTCAPTRLPPILSLLFLCNSPAPLRALHSFPTRRSSDLVRRASVSRRTDWAAKRPDLGAAACWAVVPDSRFLHVVLGLTTFLDRKSTRLNSSHVAISYAVFCLKKKHADFGPQVEAPGFAL